MVPFVGSHVGRQYATPALKVNIYLQGDKSGVTPASPSGAFGPNPPTAKAMLY